MVLGQDERLDESVRDDFERSGLAHILAVSGQNVMLLATLVLAAGAVFGIGLRARLVLALALVAFYVPLTGAGPSIQRAGVMGAAGLVAALAGRPAHRWYALGLAALVTLALNPRASGEPGWQLSFAAVIALLALGPPLRSALAHHMPGPVADVAAITIAATVGTAPLMAFHFQQVSLAALPANLLAAAAIAPVMWLGMLAATAAQLGARPRRPVQRRERTAPRRSCSGSPPRWRPHPPRSSRSGSRRPPLWPLRTACSRRRSSGSAPRGAALRLRAGGRSRPRRGGPVAPRGP